MGIFDFLKIDKSSSKKDKQIGINIKTASDVVNLYQKAYNFYKPELDRCKRAYELYTGLDFSQYPKELISKFYEDRRNLFQCNFIRKKVDGLAGYIFRNSWDFSFSNVESVQDPRLDIYKQIMYADKELLDYDYNFMQAIIDGLIHVGIERLYIDTTYDVFGRIGFKRINPLNVILDPYWVSPSSKDMMNLWCVNYLTVKELMEFFPEAEKEILDIIAYDNVDYNIEKDGSGVLSNPDSKQIGSLKKVIEWHHLEPTKKVIELSKKTGEVINGETDEEKKKYIEINNIDVSEGTVKIYKWVKEYWVTTVCPELYNLELQNKKSNIQIGRLPFVVWSFCRVNGRNSGIPELLESLQVTYNVRQSAVDSIIANSIWGNKIIDPVLFGGNREAIQKFVDNYGKHFQVFVAEPNTISTGAKFIEDLKTQNDLYNMFKEMNDLLQLSDLISKQPLVLEGISEGSEETGVLFARKAARADSILYTLYKTIEQYVNEKGEMHFLVGRELYSNIRRIMYLNGENKEIDIKYDYEKDSLSLDRVKVLVINSPKSQSIQETTRGIFFDILRTIGNAMPTVTAQVVSNILSTIPVSASDIDKIKKLCDIETKLAVARAEAELGNLTTLKMQNSMAQQNIVSQMILPQMQANQNIDNNKQNQIEIKENNEEQQIK